MLCPFFRFIRNRIQEQRDYIESVKDSNRNDERKEELLSSALEIKTRLEIQLANRYDDLISIPAEQLKIAFRPFTQKHNEDRRNQNAEN